MDMTQERAERKTLAMIAHDGKKDDMVAFATYNRKKLKNYDLIISENAL